MSPIQRLIGARVERVERRRLSLLEGSLRESELIFMNVPAEMPPWPVPTQPTPGIPVILFATDQRMLWAGYSGRSDYRPAPLGDDGAVRSVDYDGFRTFYAFPAGDSRGGFGFLMFSEDDAMRAARGVRQSLASLVDFKGWADVAMGPGASAVLSPVLLEHPQVRHLQMFLFPSRTWTPLVQSFVELVCSRTLP